MSLCKACSNITQVMTTHYFSTYFTVIEMDKTNRQNYYFYLLYFKHHVHFYNLIFYCDQWPGNRDKRNGQLHNKDLNTKIVILSQIQIDEKNKPNQQCLCYMSKSSWLYRNNNNIAGNLMAFLHNQLIYSELIEKLKYNIKASNNSKFTLCNCSAYAFDHKAKIRERRRLQTQSSYVTV